MSFAIRKHTFRTYQVMYIIASISQVHATLADLQAQRTTASSSCAVLRAIFLACSMTMSMTIVIKLDQAHTVENLKKGIQRGKVVLHGPTRWRVWVLVSSEGLGGGRPTPQTWGSRNLL